MGKRLACVLLVTVFPFIITAGRDLPGVFKPTQLVVSQAGKILVFDRSQGLLLFQNRGKQPRTIGGFGQGPGEYDTSVFITIRDEKVYLSTRGKMVVYDFHGKAKKEALHFSHSSGKNLNTLKENI